MLGRKHGYYIEDIEKAETKKGIYTKVTINFNGNLIMKSLVFLISVLFLTACTGVTTYEVTTPDGVSISVKNTKNYESYTLNAVKNEDGSYSVSLEEVGVSASDPIKASQEANGKLLDKLISLVPGT